MSDDFVVTGTRPPSALSSYRPGSAGRRYSGYHTKAQPSFVDESLFGSQHRTRLDEDLKGFKAPWEYPKPPAPRNTFAAQSNVKPPVKPKPKGRPLLWCPSPDAATHVRIKSSSAASHSNSSPDCQWNTRGNFRRMKHTPTFVDESLFGPRLQEPTFEAPWNERKKGEKRPVRPYLFDPSGGNSFENGHTVVKKRPSTALGLSRKEMRKQQASGNQRQVWKP